MIWKIKYSLKAEEDIEKLPNEIAVRIIQKICETATDPYTKLERTRSSPYYKFRVGDYRVIVSIYVKNGESVLEVVKARHRSKVYR
jgi:mRNA interferase RelE/StbE